ncbi:hypothetical protein A4R44_03638 [Amycolatopsis sp. M39]|uniref:DUF3558 domain-containing protein n=2 Tax=Amycolatopsis rubida TaxID=112413 RepID=A0A1I5L7N1_9PSEU|nr:hypothetical protein A4R44_03638 [Amycolatopsis sp. M39]SFO92886.1 hypothetical protein SAMN05421854_103466 [Amycolatopsis rubida]
MAMINRLVLGLAVAVSAAGCSGAGPAETFAKTNACELLATAARGTPIDPQRSEYKLTESAPAGAAGGVGGCRTEWNPPSGKLTGGDLAATLELGEAEDWSAHSESSTQSGHEVRKDTTKAGGGCRYQVQIPGTDAAVRIWYLDRSVSNEGSCPVAKRLVDQVIPSLP